MEREMAKFFIGVADYESDLRRCKESFADGKPITITGSKGDGSIDSFTGIVKRIEDNGEDSPPGRRFRVTIHE